MDAHIDLTPLQDLERKSLDDLIAEHGPLRKTQDLLKAVKGQHTAALDIVLAQVPDGYPAAIAPHTVRIGDAECRIHGVAHTLSTYMNPDDEYRKSVVNALHKEDTGKTVFEQHLTEFFRGTAPLESDIEMLDHTLATPTGMYRFGGTVLPVFIPLAIVALLSSKAMGFMKVKSDKMRIEQETTQVEEYLKHHRLPPELRFNARHLFNRSILELKRREYIELDAVEKRSAYMAEFVKALAPKSLDLVVGGAHVNQIRYFLEHPIYESVDGTTPKRIRKAAKQIVDLAHTHAKQAIEAPHTYSETRANCRRDYQKKALREFIIGAGPWIGFGLYEAYQLLK